MDGAEFRPLIGIDYDEPDPATYRAVTLVMPSTPYGQLRIAESRGPVYDLRAALDVAWSEGEPLLLSSVDNFISDLPVLSEQREDMRAVRAWRPR